MGAVWYRFRAEARTRWKAWVGLGLLIGIAGGAVIAALAGARRTDSAYGRFLDAARANDFSVEAFGSSPDGSPPEAVYDAIERLPGVAASGRYTALALLVPDGEGGLALPDFLPVSSDGRRFYTVDRPKLRAGRLPRRDEPREALVNQTLADERNLAVGDEIALLAPHEEDVARFVDSPDLYAAVVEAYRRGDIESRPVRFTITGIGLFPGEVAQEAASREPRLVTTPGFRETMRPPPLWTLSGLRLGPGADPDDVRAGIERVTAEEGAHVSAQVDTTRQVDRSVSPYVIALTLFAAAAGFAFLLIAGQALARQAVLDAEDDPLLHALGMGAGARIMLAVLRGSLVALVGAVVALAVALALSPVAPIGPVRDAEPDPGFAIDTVVLVPAVAALALVTVGWVALTAWAHVRRVRLARRRGSGAPSVTSRLVEAAARAGAPPALVEGVRMALSPGRGRSAIPVRTTVAGATIAVAAVVAVATFGAGIDRLVESPRLYGWDWDVAISGNGGYTDVTAPPEDTNASDTAVASQLNEEDGVEAWAYAMYGSVVVDGRGVPAVGIDSRAGLVAPTVLEGRAPSARDEVALGTDVLRRTDKDLGDTVQLRGGETTSEKRIVGRAVFPSLGFIDVVHTALGDGAMLTGQGLAELEPDAYPNAALVRLRDDDRGQATRTRLRERYADPATLTVWDELPPGEIDAYGELRWTPRVLVALLAFLAVGTLAHALLAVVRRRRRELAVLKTLGFTRREVSATLAWQATTYAVLALVVAVPVGIAAGRVAWGIFSDGIGVATAQALPVLALAAVVPVTLLVANLIAAVPGRLAARTRPALTLRAE